MGNKAGTKKKTGAGDSKKTKAAKGADDAKKTKSPPKRGTGAGRTGRAPTRHGGGRSTDPGSPQRRKKKGK